MFGMDLTYTLQVLFYFYDKIIERLIGSKIRVNATKTLLRISKRIYHTSSS